MKKGTLVLFIILGLSLLSSKDESVFLKQVELENIYRFKIESFLEKIYNKSEYYVFSDVRLEKKASPETEKQEDTSTAGDTDKDGSDPFGYTFIEGLGLNPTLPTAPINTPSNKEKKEAKSEQEYIMTGLNISVYLAEDIYTVESRETITNFVNTNIDEIRNCFDCFVLEKMPNHNSQQTNLETIANQAHKSELEELKGNIDTILSNYDEITTDYEALRDSIQWSLVTQQQNELKKELQRMIEQGKNERALLVAQHEQDAETMGQVVEQKDTELRLILESKDKELNFLIRQLDDATSARMFWEDQEARRNELQNNLDSLKYINLMSIQDDYRTRQNQLLENITGDYENSIQARINNAKGTEERLFKLLENKISPAGNNDNIDIEAYENSSSKMPLYIIISVVVALVVFLIILLTRKKKVVYLKPKNSDGTNNDNAPPPQPAYTAPPTVSNENTDVIRSEVRSLRQSAVTMSAGQKEGASQIISDWLDEGSEGNNSDDNNSDDNNSDDNNSEKE